MTPSDLEALRKSMQERAQQIVASSHAIVAEGTGALGVRTDVLDVGDESMEDAMRSSRLDFSERDRHVLVAIRGAFDRMSAGTYGLCVDCGQEIGLERLRAVPWTARCADDEERYEELRRETVPSL